jgi:hypothetical protein
VPRDREEQRRRWREEIRARAEQHWTPEVSLGLLGDKNILLPPVEAAVLLRTLGLLNGDGSMPPESVRKYRQINHMVALLEPLFLSLKQRHATVRVLDAGCGSSSLTMLLAWCFRHRWRHRAEILGVDRNEKIIARCRERAQMADLEELLRYEASSLDELDVGEVWRRRFAAEGDQPRLHAVVALHACDTATDDALGLGLALEAELIAAAPCCQAELAQAWAALAAEERPGAFSPIWASPHLRREAGATMTDALRTLLLRGCGYEVTAMQFVPTAHTPKHTLLRAVRQAETRGSFDSYLALRDALGGVDIRLAALLPPEQRRRLLSRSAP